MYFIQLVSSNQFPSKICSLYLVMSFVSFSLSGYFNLKTNFFLHLPSFSLLLSTLPSLSPQPSLLSVPLFSLSLAIVYKEQVSFSAESPAFWNSYFSDYFFVQVFNSLSVILHVPHRLEFRQKDLFQIYVYILQEQFINVAVHFIFYSSGAQCVVSLSDAYVEFRW